MFKKSLLYVPAALLFLILPCAVSASTGGENDITHAVALFVLQLAVILAAAKIGGEICERFLKQPAVLGELMSGVAIGPFALGHLIHLPYFGSLFPMPQSKTVLVPVSVELYAFAQLAAVILLFMAGLETDLNRFLRYGFKATIIAIGGVIAPFVLGDWATVAFGLVDSYMAPEALFVGAIMTATSVGITARVLSDIGKLDTPEGVTVLAGAVVDDVLGILILAVVVAVTKMETSGGSISAGEIAIIGAKAVGFWLVVTGGGILLAGKIEKMLKKFKSSGSLIALGLSLCFLVSAAAEAFGLAMIIGAYSIGLALSKTEMAHDLEHALAPIYQFTVPAFFCVMGMMVNIPAMQGALIFGIALTLLAIVSKIGGCGLPAMAVGFNTIGAVRIGIGMLPRGEVALIVAGVGLAAGVIDAKIFGVAIMMTLITTLISPVFLVPLFKNEKSGLRKKVQQNT